MPGNARAPAGDRGDATGWDSVDADDRSLSKTTPQALADLAVAIENEHQAGRSPLARTALEHALRCGQLLIQAKSPGRARRLAAMARSQLLAGRRRSAQVYMRLARELPKLAPEDAQRAAYLTVRDAISDLAHRARQLRQLPAATIDTVLDKAQDQRLRDCVTAPTTSTTNRLPLSPASGPRSRFDHRCRHPTASSARMSLGSSTRTI